MKNEERRLKRQLKKEAREQRKRAKLIKKGKLSEEEVVEIKQEVEAPKIFTASEPIIEEKIETEKSKKVEEVETVQPKTEEVAPVEEKVAVAEEKIETPAVEIIEEKIEAPIKEEKASETAEETKKEEPKEEVAEKPKAEVKKKPAKKPATAEVKEEKKAEAESKPAEEIKSVEETPKEEKPKPKKKITNELKGAFVYYKTENGGYAYKLKANNNETLAVCGGAYSSLSALKTGIASVVSNCEAHIEDLTLKKTEELTNPKFEIYIDKAEKFRYRLRAKNGEIIAIPEEGYATKASCKKGIESLARFAKIAEIVEE